VAAHFSSTGGYPGGLTEEYYQRGGYGGQATFPIRDVMLHPGTKQDWYVLVKITPTEPCVIHTRVLRFDYESAGHEGHVSMPFEMQMKAA
jgi:hypothetical protein